MTSQHFGKYEFLKKLATGGMAEVFLARQRGIEGFSKMCVVKRILPHLAEDPEFVQMFLNEAKIAARFNHPNIAQIYELGEINGSYFIAMEFIHGEDLGRVMRKAWSTGQWIARQLAMRVIVAACEGLHYAHTKTDEQGKPLKVVHRDISPQNLLISFDGSVKVVDFGIAKAADSGAMTKSGAIKGKFAYMAPEQAAGKPLDHRSDIFAIGLVLYELITGVRPLKRDSELGTLQAALECDIAPPSQVADVPSDLDDMVMRALTRNAEDRYKDARQFGQALEEYLIGQRMVATPVQISELMHTLFAERLSEEAKLGHPDPQIANDPMFSGSGSNPGAAVEPSSGGSSRVTGKASAQDMSWEAPPAKADGERSVSGEKSSGRGGPRTLAKSSQSYRTSSLDSERTVLPPANVEPWDAPSAVVPAPKARSTGETRAAPDEGARRSGAQPSRTPGGTHVQRSRTGEQPAQARGGDDDEGTLLEREQAPPRGRTSSGQQPAVRRRSEPEQPAEDLDEIEPIRTPTGRGKSQGLAARKPSRPEASRAGPAPEEDDEPRTADDLELAPQAQKARTPRPAAAPRRRLPLAKIVRPLGALALIGVVAALVAANWTALLTKPLDVVPVEITSNIPVTFSVIHAEDHGHLPPKVLGSMASVVKDASSVHPGDTILLRNAQGANRELQVSLKKGEKVFVRKVEFKTGSFIPQITAAQRLEGIELWLNNQWLAVYVPGGSVQLVEGTHMLEIRGARLKHPIQYPVTVKAGSTPTRAKPQDITAWLE